MDQNTPQGTQNINQQQSTNTSYVNASIIDKRLECQRTLDNIELFLSGKRWLSSSQTDANGNISITSNAVVMGSPRFNDKGTAALMNYLTLVFNTGVVQGNYTPEQYKHEIGTIRMSIAKYIIKNIYAWEADELEVTGIIDAIMVDVKAFLSRLIDNKERESYDQSVKVTETNAVVQKGRFGF